MIPKGWSGEGRTTVSYKRYRRVGGRSMQHPRSAKACPTASVLRLSPGQHGQHEARGLAGAVVRLCGGGGPRGACGWVRDVGGRVYLLASTRVCMCGGIKVGVGPTACTGGAARPRLPASRLQPHTHTHTHTNTDTHIHAHTRTRTHTHTHAQMLIRMPTRCCIAYTSFDLC